MGAHWIKQKKRWFDRLERVGYVERLSDPEDRGRVLVRIRRAAIEPFKAVCVSDIGQAARLPI